MTLEHRHHARCACGSALANYSSYGAARPFALAGTKRVFERPRPFAIEHIALEMVLDVEAKGFSCVAQLDIRRVDPEATEVALDAVGFELGAVEMLERGDGQRQTWNAAAHTYDGERLRITVGTEIAAAQLRVRYSAMPRRGIYFLAPDEHVSARPRQVWTQCQDEDARHIFPCHDKPHIKQTTELTVTVPSGWYALSNGELLAEDASVFHWRMNEPHPSYLFTLVAGEFSRIDDAAGGVPLSYFVPRGREADGKRTFARTKEMVQLFGQLLGVKFPWNKYAQIVVSDFTFGGMENTTATTMYEHILLDERAAIDVTSDDLIAHELAHQWFGDLVTCRDWSHAWLNEGFATFMEHVYREAHLGRDEYDYGLKGDMDAYFGEAKGRYRRPVVCHDYEAPIDLFDRHLYEKGGLILHMIRRELGDSSFYGALKRYLERHAKGVVETRDLMRAFEEVSGRSFERFFEQWLFRSGHPELEIKIDHAGDVLTVSVRQTQVVSGPPSTTEGEKPPVFAFDLTLAISVDGKIVTERRTVDQPSQVFAFRVPMRPEFVVVDPDLAVLAEVKVEAPADMLKHQILKAPTARGRMLAAPALARLDDPPTTKTLATVLANPNEFWGARAEAAAALGTLRSEAAFAVLETNAGTKHPKVRRAVANALGHFKTTRSAETLKRLALKDESYLVEAEAARALGATKQTMAFDTLVDILDRPSWADVIRVGAIDGLANLRDERAVPHVVSRTRYGVTARGRRAAILALPKLAADKKARETLEDLLDASDPHLRVDVVRALGELGDSRAQGALHQQLDRETDGRVKRRIREVLRDLGGTQRRETQRLKDELEAVRAEQAELKNRLGKLESLVTPPNATGKAHRRKK